MTDWEEELRKHQKEFDEKWLEINERFIKIEAGLEMFKRRVDLLEKQMKEWKIKYPGS